MDVELQVLKHLARDAQSTTRAIDGKDSGQKRLIAVLKKVRYALGPRRPMPYAHGGLCPVVPHLSLERL